jgi:hypothetical protein
MKLPFLFTLASLALSLPTMGAEKLESVAPSAADLARELGITLTKFSATFAEPVYATFEVRMFSVGATAVNQLTQSTPSAAKVHEFTFSVKDMELLGKYLGVNKASEAKGAWDLSVKHPLMGFTQRIKQPFAKLEVGQQFAMWSRNKPMDGVALDTWHALYIHAGPYTGADVPKTGLVDQYDQAKGYLWFGIKFSKVKPEETK